jgi:CDP-paratose 2-epimerase
MQTIIVTGSAGLIGSEASKFFHEKGFQIIGIDNNMRAYFFGEGIRKNWKNNSIIIFITRQI